MIFLKKLIINISNLKFAIILFIFIALASGLGTLIPQGNFKEDYLNLYNYKPIFGFIDGEKFLNLELDHIYTSSWFLTLLLLLCLSLAACSFRRQIPSLNASLKWIDYNNETKFKKLELASNWQVKNSDNFIENAERILRERGWNNLIKENRISSRKGIIGKLGPIIVHIGLIFLLVGSAYGNFTSHSNENFLRVNESLDLINDNNNEKLTIKLKDFFIERDSNGYPSQFISDLEFNKEGGKSIIKKTTKVNKPIRYKGLTIYQADWAISNLILKIDNLNYQFQLKPVPEIGNQIWGVLVELGYEEKKKYLITIDNENGPVKIFDALDFKETDLYLDKKLVNINSSDLELVKIIPTSGLIIKNDPSVPFIYFAFFLIMVGTTLSLIPTNQLWIYLNQESNTIYIGGLSNRNLLGFQNEFIKISNLIKIN